jgi:hypothetical protein
VNQFLVTAAREKGKKITAAVFPGPTLARKMVRQDRGRWDLDAFLPMLYNNFYETDLDWVKEQTREGVATVKKPICSGLFVHGMDERVLIQAVEKALAGGASGISIFSAEGMDGKKWRALRNVTERFPLIRPCPSN